MNLKEMKINYCCLYYCSYVVLFLSSVTKTSEDKRMATDHCCLTSMVALNMDENDDDYDIDESKSIFLLMMASFACWINRPWHSLANRRSLGKLFCSVQLDMRQLA